jgi:predicted PurR-regulated permease PerM
MKSQKAELYFFIALLIAVFALTFFIFLPFLGAIAVATVFAVIFNPLNNYIQKSVRFRGVAALIATLIVLLIVFVPVSFLGVLLFNQAQDLFTELNRDSGGNLSTAIDFVELQVNRIIPGFSLDIDSYLNQALDWLTQSLGGIFASTAQTGLSFFIGIITLFYLFRDGARLRDWLIAISPLRDAYDREIVEKVRRTINSIIKGSILVALIQGVLSGIGFMIFGVPNPALWGSVAALGALIPGIGTSLVLIPAILFLFFVVGPLPALGLLLWGAFAVGLIDNLLGPQLIGRGVRIHPLLILLSVLGGLQLFGLVGFLLGPIVLSLLLSLTEIYTFLIQKEHTTS